MPSNDLLVDSSFLIALYDRSSSEYELVKQTSKLIRGRFLIPQVVLTEVVYLLKRELGVRGAVIFLEEFTDSEPNLIDVRIDDLRRAREIMAHYADAKLDFVDCCIMALSERLNITQVCTLDQRDFSIFRPKHIDYLEILP